MSQAFESAYMPVLASSTKAGSSHGQHSRVEGPGGRTEERACEIGRDFSASLLSSKLKLSQLAKSAASRDQPVLTKSTSSGSSLKPSCKSSGKLWPKIEREEPASVLLQQEQTGSLLLGKLHSWLYNSFKSSFRQDLTAQQLFEHWKSTGEDLQLLPVKYSKSLIQTADQQHLKASLQDQIESLTLFTYRSDIWIRNKLMTDAGWGCMLRAGQMMLMQAVKRHVFGDRFSLDLVRRDSNRFRQYQDMLYLFSDCPSAPVSINSLCR